MLKIYNSAIKMDFWQLNNIPLTGIKKQARNTGYMSFMVIMHVSPHIVGTDITESESN